MNLTIHQKVILLAVGGVFIAGLCMFLTGGSENSYAGATPGNPATVATSTTDTITSTATTIAATSTTCSARVISTSGTSGIMLTFSDMFTPSGTSGHWQPASTTVAYDNGQYGCGAVKAYAGVSTLVTITESR